MKHAYRFRFLAALVASLALVACANQMEPAKKAIADVEAAVAAAGADAQTYVPDLLGGVNQKLADLKAAYDRKDYKAVLAGAPAVLTEAQGLAGAAAAKKQEITAALGAQWTGFSTDLPQQVAAIESRLGMLNKSRKLPDGVTKDTLAAANAGLDEAKRMWGEATSAFAAGDLQKAVDTANGVKAKANELMAALGMT